MMRGETPPRTYTKGGKVVTMQTASVDELIDAGVLFCGMPDEVHDQIVAFLRALRRHGQSSDDGRRR